MQNIRYEITEDIGILTISRPEVLNALNSKTLQEIDDQLKEESLKKRIKALVITGSGNKAFIAGADIAEMVNMSPLDMQAFSQLGQQVTLTIEQSPFPVIAAVNGYALGGGLEIALACDFIYAADSAQLGAPEVHLGIIPGFGGTQRLTKAVGMRIAKEMIFTGKRVSAYEAKEIGIVNKVCLDTELLQDTIGAAKAIANQSKIAISMAKKAISMSAYVDLNAGLEIEKNLCALCFVSDERKANMEKFLQRQKNK